MRSSLAHALPTGALSRCHSCTREGANRCAPCRSSVREEYMPAMRLALTAPMWGAAHGGREKDGIPQVMAMMNDYSLTRCVMRAPARFCYRRSHALRRWLAATTGRRFST